MDDCRSLIRLRISLEQAHYGGGLVDGAFVCKLFGDAATEVLIRSDGDEGLFRAYDSLEFLAPVYAGDYLEVEARLVGTGRTSRKIEFECRKVIQPTGGSSAEVLEEPVVVAKAVGTCVVPLDKQRQREDGAR
jgi:3-aminobutyryl-CoA ammonia-lyase